MEPLAQMVEAFLSTRDRKAHGRGDVVFSHTSVEGSGKGVQAAPSVQTAAKSLINVLNPLSYRSRPHSSRPLIRDFSGTVAAGEMLLVLGKPGSGCTTFLKTLANMRGEYKATTGEITYGGRSAKEMAENNPAEIAFCAEDDDHFPTLTVAETLRFAIRSRWGNAASKSKIEEAVSRLGALMGLGDVMGTKVGNAYIRGISGGERRRVSLAEALATCPGLVCLDSPTNGLDSSTATEFLQMVREFTNQLQCATAMSIYQGSDAIVPLFDKALIINSGRQIFYGKASEAKAYFEDLGFECLPRTTITDFLGSMSAGPEARRVREGYKGRVPQTAQELDEAFRKSPHYANILKSVHTDYSQQEDISRTDRAVYLLPLYRQIWLCASRQFRVLITDYKTWTIEALCIIIQSLVLGTLFRNQQRETKSFFILASALFYAVLVPALQSMSEFGNTFAQRPLVLKHKRYQFYRPLAYAFGLVVTDMVWKIVAIAYNIPLYFLTNFQKTPSNFFIWFFTVYVEHLALSMFFRAIAVFSPNMNLAVLPVGIMFNCFVLYTGLYVPGPQMQVWLGWLKYCNPLYYAFESVMVNEFASLNYHCSADDLIPSGVGYDSMANQVCAVVGSSPGQGTMSGRPYLEAQYGFQSSHLWRNIGINAGLFFAFAICTGVGMEMLKLPAGRLATVFYKAEPQDFISEKNSTPFDSETGSADEDQPPVNVHSRQTVMPPGDLLDQEGHVFAWKDICLRINSGGTEKRLLDNVDGWVEKAQLTALMGASGAGKTTLLNTLAGRSTMGTLSGDLFLDGRPLPKSFQRYMGYVQQQDMHLPSQTVREALQVTASLRRSVDISNVEKNAYVEAVIHMLEMEDIADALIGIPGAGLNLEQRKRVTIGVELAAKPDILFLDEPSSGLDGQSAVSIIRLLRKLANAGQAIICTIHQPAAELMENFDSLILLVRGGRMAYSGPLGMRCSTATEYFGRYARSCGERENPAEYFLDVVGAGSRSTATNDWAQIWLESDVREKRMSTLQEKTLPSASQQASMEKYDETFATPFHVQLKVILRRTWLYYWREPDYATSKLWMNIGNSLLNSMTYLQSPSNQRGAYGRVFSAFMSLIVGPPLGLQVEPRFVALRDIFIHREKASLTYHWLVFVLSAIIIELPYAFFTSFIYWILWYYPVGYFSSSSRAGYSFLMYELFAVFATSLAQLCAAAMPNLGSTFMANGFFFMFCNTFAGTLSPEPVTPSGWRWYYKVSPLFYLGEGMTTNMLQDLQISCDSSETSIFNPPDGVTCGAYAENFLTTATGYLLNPASNTSCEYCRYKDGQSYVSDVLPNLF
ncbi:hypothetical protein MMC22_007105 [Lobaria immixta]|nr:hypothetical protein [Lobaria immixta]